MWGVWLVLLSSGFEEAGSSVGKQLVNSKKQSIYSLGFFSSVVVVIIFGILLLFGKSVWVFSLASLPTFLIRLVLEIIQSQVTVLAIVKTDRSTYNFVRSATIPLLLIADLFLGYYIKNTQVVGLAVICLTLLIVFFNKKINKQGFGYITFCAINAVATISLYKYNITYYNSIAAEQLLICGAIAIYFYLLLIFKAKESLVGLLKQRLALIQGISFGLASVIEGFAYLYGPASIILCAKRSGAALWGALAGRIYFKEQNLVLKLVLVLGIVAGLVLLVV